MSVHDHSGFDRIDPKAVRAIAPAVRMLLAERAKPAPRDPDHQYQHSTYIDELAGEVASAARSLDVSIDELIAAAEQLLNRRPAPIPAPIVAAQAEPALRSRRADMGRWSHELANLEAENAALRDDEKRNAAALKRNGAEATALLADQARIARQLARNSAELVKARDRVFPKSARKGGR